MSLFVVVSYTEKELASETFTFFLIFVYVPLQLIKLFIELIDFFNENFFKRLSWLYSYNASKHYIYISSILAHLTSLLLIPFTLVTIFVLLLQLFAINDIVFLSALIIICVISLVNLFLFSIMSFINVTVKFHRLVRVFISLLIFLFSMNLLFAYVDSLNDLFINSLSKFVRGDGAVTSFDDITTTIYIMFISSMILLITNYKFIIKKYQR